jgi:hypothetical protein
MIAPDEYRAKYWYTDRLSGWPRAIFTMFHTLLLLTFIFAMVYISSPLNEYNRYYHPVQYRDTAAVYRYTTPAKPDTTKSWLTVEKVLVYTLVATTILD